MCYDRLKNILHTHAVACAISPAKRKVAAESDAM